MSLIQVNAAIAKAGLMLNVRRTMLYGFCSMERKGPLLTVTPHPQGEHTDCGTALRHIITRCVQTLDRQRSAAVNGDADAVHAMRVELTRLSSTLLFFSPIVTDPRWRMIESRVRSLNSRIGRARDQDVLLQYSRRRRYRSVGTEQHPLGQTGKRQKLSQTGCRPWLGRLPTPPARYRPTDPSAGTPDRRRASFRRRGSVRRNQVVKMAKRD